MVIAEIDQGALDESVRAVRDAGAAVLGLRWDLADLTQIDTHVNTVNREFGVVDILVNITGGPPPTPASGQDPAA